MHKGMEQYSLLILFMAMVVVWLFTWQPWKPRPGDELSQESQDQRDQGPGRRR